MKYFLKCRRFFTAIFAIGCLTFIAIYKGVDTSTAIALVATGLAASNAAERSMKSRFTVKEEPDV
jgi:hypothetical protein